VAATYDYQADADERIPPLLAEGANFAKIVELCAARWQALDDLAVELAAYVDLSEDAAAPGWMLDLIGEWLGEPRRGAWSDADYRYALRVRQRTRKSDGTWRDIYEVARLLRPDSATSDVTVDGAPKSVIVDIPALTDPVRLDIAQRALLRTVEATTEVALTVSTDGLAFTFDDPDLGWDVGLLVDYVP
jgi:hypothetical protein